VVDDPDESASFVVGTTLRRSTLRLVAPPDTGIDWFIVSAMSNSVVGVSSGLLRNIERPAIALAAANFVSRQRNLASLNLIVRLNEASCSDTCCLFQ